MDQQETAEAARRLLKAHLRVALYSALVEKGDDDAKWTAAKDVAQGALSDSQEAWRETLASWDLDLDDARTKLDVIIREALKQATEHILTSLTDHMEPAWVKEAVETWTVTFTPQSLLG